MIGCTRLARAHLLGAGAPKDPTRAASLLERACTGGEITACGYLGSLYAAGEGVAQDFSRAASHFKQACDKKVLTACVGLGRLYAEGNGVQRDEAKAAELFRQGCWVDGDIDVGEGCYYLGQLCASVAPYLAA